MKYWKGALKILGCLSVLFILFIGFLTYAFFSFKFTDEYAIQGLISQQCELKEIAKWNAEYLTYDYSYLDTSIRYLFHESGRIALVKYEYEDNNIRTCVVYAEQTRRQYEDLKRFILERYEEGAVYDTDTPLCERITLALENSQDHKGYRIGYYCHRMPGKFNQIRARINKLAMSKLN